MHVPTSQRVCAKIIVFPFLNTHCMHVVGSHRARVTPLGAHTHCFAAARCIGRWRKPRVGDMYPCVGNDRRSDERVSVRVHSRATTSGGLAWAAGARVAECCASHCSAVRRACCPGGQVANRTIHQAVGRALGPLSRGSINRQNLQAIKLLTCQHCNCSDACIPTGWAQLGCRQPARRAHGAPHTTIHASVPIS
jgi:hypothetical protein